MMVKSPCNNKTPAKKNKIFGPFRFVEPRFQCIMYDVLLFWIKSVVD